MRIPTVPKTTGEAGGLRASLSTQASAGKYNEPDDAAFFASSPYITDQGIKLRILIERLIVRTAVTELLAHGLVLRLHDGEDWATERTDSAQVIMEAIMSTDEDTLVVHDEGGKRIGSVVFIYGNSGWDVMADNSVNLERYLVTAVEMTDAMCLVCP